MCLPPVHEQQRATSGTFRTGESERASITLGESFHSVLTEGVCAKLKPDWVSFLRTGMQLLTCSQTEQEKHNDESLPLPLALQSFFEKKDALPAPPNRQANIIRKTGRERMTFRVYICHEHMVYFWREVVDICSALANDKVVTLAEAPQTPTTPTTPQTLYQITSQKPSLLNPVCRSGQG